jgi:four helix bundle protein
MTGMGVKRVDELRVWQQAKEFTNAVSALVDRDPLRRDFALRDQLGRASLSIVANIAEGFAQSSDRGFARCLVIVRGSTAEVRTLLVLAS